METRDENQSGLLRRLDRRSILRYLFLAGLGVTLDPLTGCLGPKPKPIIQVANSASPTPGQPAPSPHPATIPTPGQSATATAVTHRPTTTASPSAPTPTATKVPPSSKPTNAPTRTNTPGPLPSETVGLAKGSQVDEVVRQAVAASGGLKGVVRSSSTVVLKVNLTAPSPSGSGVVTDYRVVRTLIDLCKEAGAAKVVVCDGAGGSNGDTTAIMKQAGYEPLLKIAGVSFLDLNQDQVMKVTSPSKLALAEYAIAKTVAQADVFISVAVLKTHNEAGVTLTSKNLFGITPISSYTNILSKARYKLHEAGIHGVIADLNLLRPIHFAVIDGITGMEGNGPAWGVPVQTNLIVAGRNSVAVDAVGTAVMGFQPGNIQHLVTLAQKGIGSIDLSHIPVRGTTIESVARKFKRPG